MKVPECFGQFGSCVTGNPEWEAQCTGAGQVRAFEYADPQNLKAVECDLATRNDCWRIAHIQELRNQTDALAGRFHKEVHAPECTCSLCVERKSRRRWY